MSQVVHKYNIPKQKFSKVTLPIGVKLARVGVQRDPDTNEEKVVVWGIAPVLETKVAGEIVKDTPMVSVKFASVPTGAAVAPGYEYLGTVQLEGSTGREAVFHVFYDSQAPISKA
jgi:hypothetical protein